MDPALTAEDHLRAGDPAQALRLLQDQVRAKPGDAKLRIFLFQLLCVLGQWERALTQLQVAAELDASALAMAQTYREAIKCEMVRAEVFAGRKAPMVFGQPEAWLALLIEALLREGQGEQGGKGEKGDGSGADLRERAFDEAAASSGSLRTGSQAPEESAVPFEWIADSDMRLGPVLEAIVNGRYYWIPFARLALIRLDPPEDLRDAVWMPAQLRFENGGESVALIPARYPGSEASGDGLLALSRKTLWNEAAAETFTGIGQRVLTTDGGEFPLMDLRSIEITAAGSGATTAAGG